MITVVIATAITLLALVALVALGLESAYRRRPTDPLEVIADEWQYSQQPQHYSLSGKLIFRNPYRKLEVMVPQVWAEMTLLSQGNLEAIDQQIQIIPHHPDAAARPDGYWFAYIVKSRKQTEAEIRIDLQGVDLDKLQAIWLRTHYLVYGPKGRFTKVHHQVIPLSFPSLEASKGRWRPVAQGDVLPIRTHLLTPLDSPVAIVQRYVVPHAQAGDIVTIGETPIAIMQGRWQDPAELKPGWVASRVCQFFLPTSSLATACGMQSLVEIVGPTRVLFAFLIGSVAKLLGKPGVFYQLAGEQARLIDDVTGTLPPYDQFIVPGPDNPQQVVDQIKAETGLSAAIVDVNDLQAVKILAATADIPTQLLESALRSNPAGNADEQTPVVLIRPTDPLQTRRGV